MEVKEILKKISDFFEISPEVYWFDKESGKITVYNHFVYKSLKDKSIGVESGDKFYNFIEQKRKEISDNMPYCDYLKEKMDYILENGFGMMTQIIRSVAREIENDIKK